MTEPASAISRRLNELIQRQINVLQESDGLTETELCELRLTIAEINTLFGELDRNKLIRSVAVQSAKRRFHHSV